MEQTINYDINTITVTVTVTELEQFITSCHNPNLVIRDESPNANTIYHVYSDGEVSEQKGGFAYLQRTERVIFPDKFPNKYSHIFPLKRTNDYGKTFGYAIVTLSDAIRIVNLMSKLFSS